VQIPVHEAEEGNNLHVIFSYKNCIERIQSHGGNIEIGEMVRAKNVLLFWIELYLILNREWKRYQCKQRSRPPPVKNTYELVLFSENDRDQKQYKKNDEEQEKNDYTIDGVNPFKKIHGL
jgi:hypothetical protein